MQTADVDMRGTDPHLRAGAQSLEYDAIADRIAADAPGRVLDWGSGYGQMTRRLVDRGVPTTSYEYREGAEPAKVPIERYPGLEMHVSGDPVALPFPDGAFDAVLSCGVLEHVGDPEASLDELHRVLAPGGRLYVYKLPNRTSYLEAIAKRLGWYYHGALPDDRLYDVASATALAQAHGFAVGEARFANLLPLTLTHDVFQRLAEPIWRLNRLLARVPGLRRLATNVELVATRR